MRTLVFDVPSSYFNHDIERIVRACESYGFSISPTCAQLAWEAYSESFAAGWLNLPDDDREIVDIMRYRCREI